jgi:hypothetical protein
MESKGGIRGVEKNVLFRLLTTHGRSILPTA